MPLAAGNVISDEPGYYEDNKFGIRIENIILCREVQTRHNFGDKPYLGFDHATLVPMCRKLIDAEMLTAAEREWLDAYHKEVEIKTKDYLRGDDFSLAWLKRECLPIGSGS